MSHAPRHRAVVLQDGDVEGLAAGNLLHRLIQASNLGGLELASSRRRFPRGQMRKHSRIHVLVHPAHVHVPSQRQEQRVGVSAARHGHFVLVFRFEAFDDGRDLFFLSVVRRAGQSPVVIAAPRVHLAVVGDRQAVHPSSRHGHDVLRFQRWAQRWRIQLLDFFVSVHIAAGGGQAQLPRIVLPHDNDASAGAVVERLVHVVVLHHV
mmetsp:Transcript_25710/g.71824  ORF Transcript_25710/g.71824 Transcript_25710/m.71824 type:complete len:207 (+) Transcript_25710:1016-1636(+)